MCKWESFRVYTTKERDVVRGRGWAGFILVGENG